MTHQQKRENYKKVSKQMQLNCLKTINRLTNLANTSYYEYTDKDLADLLEPLEKALNSTKLVLQGIKKGVFEL